MVFHCNYLIILHCFRYITTFTASVTAYDLRKSLTTRLNYSAQCHGQIHWWHNAPKVAIAVAMVAIPMASRMSVFYMYTINLPNAIALYGAYDAGRAQPSSRDLLQWVVGLQQQRRRLFMRKAEVSAYCA